MRYSKFDMVMRQSAVYESKYEYTVTSPLDVYKFAKNIMELDAMPEERVIAISVSATGGINGFCEVSKGTINGSYVNPREVFRTAIMQNAASLVLMHNHPSGSASPSDDDLVTTERLVKAGEILGIAVIDHVIVGSGGYCSLKELGIIK